MKRLTIIGLSLLLLILSPALVSGQSAEQEKIAEMERMKEARRQRDALRAMDSAILLLKAGEYAKADERFRQTLRTIRTVPSDLAFYFGLNSYQLGKYRQGIDWLTKYIQLKGTTGSHSSEAVDYLKRSEEALLAEMNQQKTETAEILSRDYDIDCGPSGKVVCPVCSGKTVIVKRTYLGEKFSTCPHCDQHGFLTCEQYNQLLRGKLQTVR